MFKWEVDFVSAADMLSREDLPHHGNQEKSLEECGKVFFSEPE